VLLPGNLVLKHSEQLIRVLDPTGVIVDAARPHVSNVQLASDDEVGGSMRALREQLEETL
jgi:hypothetical protein